jgi:hypothetical protein
MRLDWTQRRFGISGEYKYLLLPPGIGQCVPTDSFRVFMKVKSRCVLIVTKVVTDGKTGIINLNVA